MGRQMTPCKRVAKEDLINWIVTRVHRFNLTANSVERILNVIVDPFVTENNMRLSFRGKKVPTIVKR